MLEDGTSVEGEQQIGEVMVDYFKHIFTSTAPTECNRILQGIETKVTPQMNAELTSELAVVEVEQALKQMRPLSAPGLDGMSPIFFKSFWNIVGLDVIEASLPVLNTGSIPENFNHTHIALIPKTKNPEKPKDFRPISLCNVLYKLIAKTIANHLKKLMPKLVSKSQSAFMSNQLISDNTLIAFETLHHLKSKRKGKTGYMALNLT